MVSGAYNGWHIGIDASEIRSIIGINPIAMRIPFFLPLFCLILVAGGCATRSSVNQQPRDLEALFKKADTDGDGAVSREEFADFMVTEVFSNYDPEGKGFVTLQDFVSRGGSEENFRRINRNGDGRITLDEARASRLVVESMTAPFDEADTDQSGFVTWDEFQSFRQRAQPYVR